MARLSVNINKIATLRNARGGNKPDVVQCALDCERFGAEGITVHPRPDQRHIRTDDVRSLRPLLHTEFNMEGNPEGKSFRELVLEVVPEQATLVPDATGDLTSHAGWDTVRHRNFLREVCAAFHAKGIRTSIFIDPLPAMAEGAADCGADRVELYTARYAEDFGTPRQEETLATFVETARVAQSLGLGVNAGHDLSLDNLSTLLGAIPGIAEVSIGHALICDALYLGLEKTIAAYLAQVGKKP